MSHTGPLGLPRPGVRCNQSIAFEVARTYTGEEKDNIESNLSSQIDHPVHLEQGLDIGSGTGSTDVVVDVGGSFIEDEELSDIRDALFNEGLQVSGWRIGNI